MTSGPDGTRAFTQRMLAVAGVPLPAVSPQLQARASLRKGAPFAGYEDFEACVRANQDKSDPDAYCGAIKHKVEGSLQKEARWERRHYEDLASAISHHPLREQLSRAFARSLSGSNPNYDSGRFRDAASSDYYRPRGGTAYPDYTRQHYVHVADTLKGMGLSHEQLSDVAGHFADHFDHTRGNFDRGKFFRAIMNDMPAPARRAPRTSESPGVHNPRVSLPSEYSEAEGRSPDRWSGIDRSELHTVPYQHSGDQYTRTYGPGDEERPIDPIFGQKKQGASTLPYQHEIVDPDNAEVPQADQFNEETMFPLDPAFEATWQTTPNGAAPVSRAARLTAVLMRPAQSWTSAESALVAAHMASLRKQADFMTRPHKTTDDFAEPYNRPETTASPFPGQNSSDGDYQAGLADGQKDARAAERPTFMDSSSRVSPYVKGYAEGYASVPQEARGPQDVPMSMGGDSGQPQNVQEAGTAFQVSKASLSKRADPVPETTDLAAHLAQVHGLDPDVLSSYGPEALTRAHKNVVPTRRGESPKRWQYSAKLGASADFVTGEAEQSADFRKAYVFARRWTPGTPLVRTGSAAFEAGLYAGITDNPQHQEAWVSRHRAQEGTFPFLGARLSAHEEFTRAFTRARRTASQRGLYVQAGTSTDLITDGPGTSPDPMGSTPINGPGTPPPDGGKGNPARPGGPPPYQDAEPAGAGPAVPDDVMGQPQEPPQPVGPPAMGFSGPGPGYTNINLAPRAPDQAARPGYSNPAADQGNPHHDGNRTAAFRAVVQANLQRMRERQPA